MTQYVLYVAYDRADVTRSRFCPGSRRAIELVDEANQQDQVTVQSVDVLRRSVPTLPEWLRGTPTLVCRETRKAMRGTAALDHLRSMRQKHHESQSNTRDSAEQEAVEGLVTAREMPHLERESNFEPLVKDDPSKYDESKKITDADLQRLIDRRKAGIPPT